MKPIELVIGSRGRVNKCVYKCCVGQGWQVVWSALGLLFLALRDGACCMGMKKKCMYHTIEEREISAALPRRVAGYQPVFIYLYTHIHTLLSMSLVFLVTAGILTGCKGHQGSVFW